MIPPEPGPDPPTPPEPTVPAYTYSTSSPITLGSVTGTVYKDIQQNGTDCKLVVAEDGVELNYPHIILYEVGGTQYCYFVRSSGSAYIGVLGNNSGIGLTVPSYYISNGSVTQSEEVYIDSSVPSDYYSNVKTRNLTLTQRS